MSNQKIFDLRRKLINLNHQLVTIQTNSEIDEFNKKQVNSIIFNEPTHIVASFKDYLILDDSTEFFKRFYKKQEQNERLIKILDFYEENSKIFPNYISLEESKYIYKNIQKKQKLIDDLQAMEYHEKEKEKRKSKNAVVPENVINKDEYNSIMNQTQSQANIKESESANKSIELLIDSIEKADKEKDEKPKSQISSLIENFTNSIKEKTNHQKTNSINTHSSIDFKKEFILSKNENKRTSNHVKNVISVFESKFINHKNSKVEGKSSYFVKKNEETVGNNTTIGNTKSNSKGDLRVSSFNSKGLSNTNLIMSTDSKREKQIFRIKSPLSKFKNLNEKIYGIKFNQNPKIIFKNLASNKFILNTEAFHEKDSGSMKNEKNLGKAKQVNLSENPFSNKINQKSLFQRNLKISDSKLSTINNGNNVSFKNMTSLKTLETNKDMINKVNSRNENNKLIERYFTECNIKSKDGYERKKTFSMSKVDFYPQNLSKNEKKDIYPKALSPDIRNTSNAKEEYKSKSPFNHNLKDKSISPLLYNKIPEKFEVKKKGPLIIADNKSARITLNTIKTIFKK